MDVNNKLQQTKGAALPYQAALNSGSKPLAMSQGLAGSINKHKVPTEEKQARDTPKGLRGSHNHPESQEPHIQKETHVATGGLAVGVQYSPMPWCIPLSLHLGERHGRGRMRQEVAKCEPQHSTLCHDALFVPGLPSTPGSLTLVEELGGRWGHRLCQ